MPLINVFVQQGTFKYTKFNQQCRDVFKFGVKGTTHLKGYAILVFSYLIMI